jgi:hypothetical protein
MIRLRASVVPIMPTTSADSSLRKRHPTLSTTVSSTAVSTRSVRTWFQSPATMRPAVAGTDATTSARPCVPVLFS